jgi:hypothetical protein
MAISLPSGVSGRWNISSDLSRAGSRPMLVDLAGATRWQIRVFPISASLFHGEEAHSTRLAFLYLCLLSSPLPRSAISPLRSRPRRRPAGHVGHRACCPKESWLPGLADTLITTTHIPRFLLISPYSTVRTCPCSTWLSVVQWCLGPWVCAMVRGGCKKYS